MTPEAFSPAAGNANQIRDWLSVRMPAPLVVLFGGAGLLLVPWIVLLIKSLPATHRAAHWDIAWAGFDVLLALLLITVAITAWRRSAWLEGAATATATLLFVDAWFDVLTSSTNTELTLAIVEAVLVELPLAVLCLLLARSAERRLASLVTSRSTPDAAASGEPPGRDSAPNMEHLWSRAGANGGEPAQIRPARKRLNQADSVAVGCS